MGTRNAFNASTMSICAFTDWPAQQTRALCILWNVVLQGSLVVPPARRKFLRIGGSNPGCIHLARVFQACCITKAKASDHTEEEVQEMHTALLFTAQSVSRMQK